MRRVIISLALVFALCVSALPPALAAPATETMKGSYHTLTVTGALRKSTDRFWVYEDEDETTGEITYAMREYTVFYLPDSGSKIEVTCSISEERPEALGYYLGMEILSNGALIPLVGDGLLPSTTYQPVWEDDIMPLFETLQYEGLDVALLFERDAELLLHADQAPKGPASFVKDIFLDYTIAWDAVTQALLESEFFFTQEPLGTIMLETSRNSWEDPFNIYQEVFEVPVFVFPAGTLLTPKMSYPLSDEYAYVYPYGMPHQRVDANEYTVSAPGVLYTYEFYNGGEQSYELHFMAAGPEGLQTPMQISEQVLSIPPTGTAYAAKQSVKLDGRAVGLEMYALRDEDGGVTNFVRVRDIAALLKGSAAEFEVSWDGMVHLSSGERYTPTGGEMGTPFSGNRSYQASASPTMVDGSARILTAFLLTDDAGGGYTYYKLRDLGRALGFYVGWSAEEGVFLDSGRPYTE